MKFCFGSGKNTNFSIEITFKKLKLHIYYICNEILTYLYVLKISVPSHPHMQRSCFLASEVCMSKSLNLKGHARLVEAISRMYSPRFGRHIDPMSQVLPSVGGYGSLFYATQAFLNHGDEVHLPLPLLVNFSFYPLSHYLHLLILIHLLLHPWNLFVTISLNSPRASHKERRCQDFFGRSPLSRQDGNEV